MKKTTLERLLAIGKKSELFGLFSSYDLKKVAKKISLFGLTGKEFWSKKAIETILEPFRNHSRQNNLSEKAIDEALCYFAETANIDKNLVRRVYWGVASSEPKEKPEEKTEELISEAEDELPDFLGEESEEGLPEEGTEKESD